FFKGPFQQHLCNPRLGVDVGALAAQDQADESEEERRDKAGHYFGSPVIACDKREAFAQGSEATKQSTLSLLGEMDCFASLAMTIRTNSVAVRCASV
ncbi:MAG TPA: hypothetical protein VNM70_04560, partial [Burkholderiales bacterium]|nr:hypothetical protein [Burkholderiales bacterium]